MVLRFLVTRFTVHGSRFTAHGSRLTAHGQPTPPSRTPATRTHHASVAQGRPAAYCRPANLSGPLGWSHGSFRHRSPYRFSPSGSVPDLADLVADPSDPQIPLEAGFGLSPRSPPDHPPRSPSPEARKAPRQDIHWQDRKRLDFLGYHFSPRGLTPARQTIENLLERAIRLYGQEPGEEMAPVRLGAYVRRWEGWARAGLDNWIANERPIALSGR